MHDAVLIAVITGGVTIVGAALSFYLSKRHEIDAHVRREKISHYKDLMIAISDLVVDGIDKEEANMRFARVANTMVIAAPKNVIKALMMFHDEVKYTNSDQTPEGHDRLLIDLLLAIREDVGVAQKDEKRDFTFHLIGSRPPE